MNPYDMPYDPVPQEDKDLDTLRSLSRSKAAWDKKHNPKPAPEGLPFWIKAGFVLMLVLPFLMGDCSGDPSIGPGYR